MPGDALFKSAPQPRKSLEAIKKAYKERLDAILGAQLTVENIETFGDDALNTVLALVEEIRIQYRTNEAFVPHNDQNVKTAQEEENESFMVLGLPNVNEVLQSIIDVKEKIDSLKSYIRTDTENVDRVITPSDPENRSIVEQGNGGFAEKRIFPRLLTLLYIIEHDFSIPASDLPKPKEGIVTPEMLRKTPYIRVEIPELNRVVYICDEEGNTSYVFDTEKLKGLGLTLEEIDVEDKGDKNSLIISHPGVGIKFRQSSNWRTNMANFLKKEIPIVALQEGEKVERISEFKRGSKEYLSFEQFQDEVRSLYPGEGDVQTWYARERLKHAGWPSDAYKFYKNKGFTGFPELVGIENRLKKEYLSFEDFQKEATSLYPGKGVVSEWYRKERKNHPNWSSNPTKTYKGKGWVGWPELVGRKNQFKNEYPSLMDFQNEIRGLYPGEGDVQAWYRKERKNHPNWHSAPHELYKDSGWVGWPELVGRENILKKEYLPFDQFKNQVQSLYSSKGDIQKWYDKERLNHPNWHSVPQRYYLGKGWIGWPELAGVENRLKKEYPAFSDFQTEVRQLYSGQGDIRSWYMKERTNHSNWHSAPDKFYNKRGWISWSELVEKESRLK